LVYSSLYRVIFSRTFKGLLHTLGLVPSGIYNGKASPFKAGMNICKGSRLLYFSMMNGVWKVDRGHLKVDD